MQSHYKNKIDNRKRDHFEREKRIREKASHINRVSTVARKQATVTGFQKMAMGILETAGINFVYEKAIRNIKSFYLIDIYLPEHRICIEIDGSSHDMPEKKEADRARDEYLKSKGYWVFRIHNYEVRDHLLYRIKSIIKIRTYWLEKKGKKTCKNEKKE